MAIESDAGSAYDGYVRFDQLFDVVAGVEAGAVGVDPLELPFVLVDALSLDFDASLPDLPPDLAVSPFEEAAGFAEE